MATQPSSPTNDGATLFLRKYRINIIAPDGDTIFDTLIGTFADDQGNPSENNALEVSALRCTFEFERQYMSLMPTGSVTIFNLNPDTEVAIFAECLKGGVSVEIEAGYENGPYGLIFRGRVYQPVRGKEDAVTYFLKLNCLDGDDELNLNFVSTTLYRGYTAEEVLKTVSRGSRIPFDVLVTGQLSGQKAQRGKAVFGTPHNVVRTTANNNQAAFRFQNGQAVVSTVGQQPDPKATVKLTYATGVVGIPQQIEFGVSLKCLINPLIEIDKFIELDNKEINLNSNGAFDVYLQQFLDRDGLYRVIGIKCHGDTRGNDWYYDLETVTQAGFLPAMLNDDKQSGY